MKKVVLSMALIAMMSVSFVSCKEKAAEAEAEATEEVAPAEEPVATPAEEEVAPVEADTMHTEEAGHEGHSH
jgi:hypothetical protein